MKKLFFLAAGLILICGLVMVAMSLAFLSRGPQPEGREVVFDLQPGPFGGVAHDLEQQGLITDAYKFKILARVTGYSNKVRVGEYALRTDMTPMEVLRIIVSGKSILHPLTVVEGANIFDVADLIEKKGYGKKAVFLSLCRDSKVLTELLGDPLTSCEGYLFPETYELTKYTDEKALLTMMIDRFLQNYQTVAEQARGSGMSRHQIITLASIVEKETGAVEERPIISSIYHNRLKQGMRLQADPTVLYGKWEKTGDLQLSITREDLTTPNRYNTYTQTGLPYGPIANPGLEAIKATLAPATTDYLYFVSKNDGTHVFSKDYEAHSKAVHDFQQNAKAREGKSWRDLNHKKDSVPEKTTPLKKTSKPAKNSTGDKTAAKKPKKRQ